MRQATQSSFQGAMEMEKSPSAVPESILAARVAPEDIRQLFIDFLREGYIIRSWAVGGSMSPCIKKGDLLVVRPIGFKEVRIGEIVAYLRNESHSVLTTHRVVQQGKDGHQRYLITKGDRNVYRDLPLVSPQDVLGKVVGIERKGQLISLKTPFYRLRGYLIARLSLGLWILHVLKGRIFASGQFGQNGRDD